MTFDPKQIEEIHHVSQGMFSVARHFGAARIHGVLYLYDPKTDALIREDVAKARKRAAKKARRAAPLAPTSEEPTHE
jgi:hypothetical protein